MSETLLYALPVFRFHVEFHRQPLAGGEPSGNVPLCAGAFGDCTGLEATMEPKTIKVGERVFHITEETRIRKDGKTALLEDAKVGEEVGLSYRQVDGKLMALSLRLGPAPAGAAKGEKQKKEKKAN